jgi:hypothetical protein
MFGWANVDEFPRLPGRVARDAPNDSGTCARGGFWRQSAGEGHLHGFNSV